MTIRHIVAVVDHSEPSRAAFTRADCLAKQCGATLDCVDSLDGIARRLGPAELVVIGNPNDRARETRPLDMAQMLRALTCPTLVVREDEIRAAVPMRRVLFAADASAASTQAGALPVIHIARAFGAEIFVFHAWEAPGEVLPHGPPIPSQGERIVRERALRRVAQLRAALQEAASDLTIHMNVQRGAAPERIAAEVKRVDADLVALGRGGTSASEPASLGGVAEDTLRRVSCSVLIAGTTGVHPDPVDRPSSGL